MKELQKILGTMRQAVDKYQMIAPGDRIAIGVSGGKDSLVLLTAMAQLAKFYPNPFTLCAVTVSPGFDGQTAADFDHIARFCAALEVPFTLEETQIARIVFEERQETSPCSLCAKLRRGALCQAAVSMGANKLALGHHRDDVVETFMLNLMQTGHMGCFMPVTAYEDTGMAVIRPLVYTGESEIRSLANKMDLPVYENPCPADGETERERMKGYLRGYDRDKRGLYRRILGALERSGLDGWHT